MEDEDSGPEKVAVPCEVYQIMIHGPRGRSWSTISDRLVRLLSISGSKERHPQNHFLFLNLAPMILAVRRKSNEPIARVRSLSRGWRRAVPPQISASSLLEEVITVASLSVFAPDSQGNRYSYRTPFLVTASEPRRPRDTQRTFDFVIF